jgi:hypothetical protein
MSPSTPYAREPDLPGDGGGAAGSTEVGVAWIVVPASTFELGSVGPASEEEPHPAISIAIATAIAIRRRYECLGLILAMGRFSRSCTGTHLLS